MLEVRRAADRFVTRAPGVLTRHAFSFGPHYDPAHTGHGRLVVHDEHRLEPHGGFGAHPHRDVEVVSWVLEGVLVHEDDAGAVEVPAGTVQRMVAGGGVVHVERAGAAATRFLQLWLVDEPGRARSYAQAPVGELAEVLPGVHAGRLRGSWPVPDVARVHLHVASGSAVVGGDRLGPGDAARLTSAGALRVEAEQAQLLVVALPDE